MQKTGFCISEGVSKVQDIPSFLLFHRFSSSDYAELTEHSCFTDYARNLNGFGLTAIPAKNASSSVVPIKSPARRPAGFAIRR